MKTTHMNFVITIIVIFFTLTGCFGKSNPAEEHIIKTIKEFYTDYIKEIEKTPINITKINSLKEKYCTTALFNKINAEDLGYDQFIKAQDVSSDFRETMTIKKDTIGDNVYIVSYVDSYNGAEVKIKFRVVMENKSYKIEAIW